MSLVDTGEGMAAGRAAHDRIRARDAGVARAARLTRGAAVLALAGTGALAAYAASSFHGRRAVTLTAAVGPLRAPRGSPASLPVPSPTVPVPGTSGTPSAPAPAPATAAGGAASGPTPPASAPAAATAPPVVVSGGS
jgi:hypothetical protein